MLLVAVRELREHFANIRVRMVHSAQNGPSRRPFLKKQSVHDSQNICSWPWQPSLQAPKLTLKLWAPDNISLEMVKRINVEGQYRGVEP